MCKTKLGMEASLKRLHTATNEETPTTLFQNRQSVHAGERDNSAHTYWMLLHRIWVQFPILTQQLTAICNSSSKRSDALLWLLKESGMHMVHTHIHTSKTLI